MCRRLVGSRISHRRYMLMRPGQSSDESRKAGIQTSLEGADTTQMRTAHSSTWRRGSARTLRGSRGIGLNLPWLRMCQSHRRCTSQDPWQQSDCTSLQDMPDAFLSCSQPRNSSLGRMFQSTYPVSASICLHTFPLDTPSAQCFPATNRTRVANPGTPILTRGQVCRSKSQLGTSEEWTNHCGTSYPDHTTCTRWRQRW